MVNGFQGNDRLPIKLIMPKQGTERKNNGGGSKPVPFRMVDSEYRKSLLNQVDAIHMALIKPLSDVSAAPIRVKVIPKATAKSHRPNSLFSEETCPIIGAGAHDELFLKATHTGLQSLANIISHNDSEQIIKEL